MKPIFLLFLFVIALAGCQDDFNTGFAIEMIKSDRFYDEEIIPTEFESIYGKWKLYDISGGFSGSGHDLDFEYLEMKPMGIYGLEQEGKLIEYGMVEIDTFDNSSPEIFQITLAAEFPSGLPSYFSSPEKYVYFFGNDTLNLVSPCCDMHNYHFKRVR